MPREERYGPPGLTREQIWELIREIFRYGPKRRQVPGWLHEAARASGRGLMPHGGDTHTPFGTLLR